MFYRHIELARYCLSMLVLATIGCGAADEKSEARPSEDLVADVSEGLDQQDQAFLDSEFQDLPEPVAIPKVELPRKIARSAIKSDAARSGSNQSAKLKINPPKAVAKRVAEPSIAMQPLPQPIEIESDFETRQAPRSTNEPRQLAMSAPEAAGSEPENAESNAGTQATINVFYATDRKSKLGIAPGDWLRVHFTAMIFGVIYLIAFASVFLSSRKAFSGLVAFGSLAAFLFLAQSATVNWQKLKRLDSNNDPVYLSDIRSNSTEPLEYGTCEVTIPPNHQTGHLDSPSILKFEFSENPEKHVVLHRVVRSSKDQFYDEMVNVMNEGRSRQGLVFIHGYNVGFDDAVKRTAQIAHDLEFDGAPICYSWSSHGALANYTHDMANADATVLSLQSFLEETVERTGNSTIHLIAHSMGNRALLQALDRIAVSNPETNDMFGQLVMAAPDVSERDFRNRYAESAKQLARTVTLYASSRDKALIASTEIHGHNRAGLAGKNLVIINGMDTIDVSEIDTSLIGHNYYGDHPELIKDLRALVELSRPASQREWLNRIINPRGFGYFRFAEFLRRSAESIRDPDDRR